MTFGPMTLQTRRKGDSLVPSLARPALAQHAMRNNIHAHLTGAGTRQFLAKRRRWLSWMGLEDGVTYGSKMGQGKGDNQEVACDARALSWEGLRL